MVFSFAGPSEQSGRPIDGYQALVTENGDIYIPPINRASASFKAEPALSLAVNAPSPTRFQTVRHVIHRGMP